MSQIKENQDNKTLEEKTSNKRKLSRRSILSVDSIKLKRMKNNNIEEMEQNITNYLDEMVKIDKLNSHIDAILNATAQGNSGIILAASHIKECKENGLWNSSDVNCKILEESIEKNLENAKRAIPLAAMVSNLDKTLEDIVISISCNGPTDEMQKKIVQNELSNIKNFSERITKVAPIEASALPDYIKFICDECNIDSTKYAERPISFDSIKAILNSKIEQFKKENNELQEVLSNHNIRIMSNSGKIKDIGNLKMTETAIKLDLAINELKEQRDKISDKEGYRFDEIEQKWENEKTKLKSNNKLKDISKYSEKAEVRAGFWKLRGRTEKEKEKLKDNKELSDTFNKLLSVAKQLNTKLNKFKTQNILKGVDVDIQKHTQNIKVMDVVKTAKIETKGNEKDYTNT